MAVVELNIPRLSSFYSIPSSSINTLLDAPTADLVATLLGTISSKIDEYDVLKSSKLKSDVELENAVRGGEAKNRVLRNAIDKSHRDTEDLKEQLESIESELNALKSSTASSDSEVDTLKTRISSLESSNRDTLALLESKSTTYDRLAEELSAQHQKTLDLRKEVSKLEEENRSVTAASASAKFREQNLQQEIEHLKRNNDWLNQELNAKSHEYTKYRKDKAAQIAESKRQNEELENEVDASRRREQALRTHVEELGHKIEGNLSRIQNLEEDAATKTEQFVAELDSANRLAELSRNAANNERSRHQDLLTQLENAKESSQDEFARLGAELDTEHSAREEAERRVDELEAQLEGLENEITKLRSQGRSNEPLYSVINGHPSTPGRDGSPSSRVFSPGPSRLKGGLTFTQLYSEHSELKSQLAAERQSKDRLQASVDEMIQDLESSRPEVEEVRTENDRLHANITEMSSLMDEVGKERDQALKNARKVEGQIEAKTREGEVLRQQIRDLSTQIKILLFEIDRRDKGLQELSAEQQLQLEQLARGEWNDETAEGVTDTDRLINEELVMFRDVAQLQQQNSKLLNLTRQLGEQMEHEEALRKQNEAARDPTDYKQLYERCQDEIKSLVTQSQSYIRERDMFRRMLSTRRTVPQDDEPNSMLEGSVNRLETPATPSHGVIVNSVEQPPTSEDMADYAKLLKEMQAHFDAYRNEAATDRSTLKEQVDSLSKANSELRSDISRSQSQVTLAHERYNMLQTNYTMLKAENTELQKRLQFYSDNATKQDLRTQQAAEDLVEAKGLLDSMRNENANLKVEREFYKSVEKRLTEDNEIHFNERARLNSLNASLQTLLNEREHSDAEARRKLQSQADSLEQELSITKKRLSEESEEHKRAVDRREYEQQHSQKRIDDLISSISSLREELIASKTAKDHLSTRVDELNIELRSAEERVKVLQPPPAFGASETVNTDAAHRGETGLSQEQELSVQISELKRDLDLVRGELDNAKSQIEQYKAISQSSEEELQNLNDTQELYRQEMDKAIEERDLQIRLLGQKIKDIDSELATTNSELSTLRIKEAESDRRLQEQKLAFEAEIAELRDQDDRHATAAKYHQEDLKAQAEIAQQAQQNYENELVKHAEAAKALQQVRNDHNNLKIQIFELKAEAESARANLSQSEDSWMESKERYERELTDLKVGRENLNSQNNRLHQQLDSLSSQISKLQKRPLAADDDESSQPATDAGLDNLQEVIKYLRREKEIADVQLELSVQEARRFKQQLDYTQSQLDDTRLRLNQQRRQEEDSERTALSQSKLLETINELNMFRESNVTLRNESRQAQASLAQKIQEVEGLIAQIEPLRAEVEELQNYKETQLGEARLLQEDRDRWRQRTQDILQRYDRIDPTELESLKTQVSNLETERDGLQSSKHVLEERLETQSAQAQEQAKEKVEELRSRLTEQFKARSKQLSGTIRERESSLQNAVQERQDLEQRLASLQEELQSAKSERDRAVKEAEGAPTNTTDTTVQDVSEDGQVDEAEKARSPQNNLQSLQDKVNTTESLLNEETSRSKGLQDQVATYQSTISGLEAEMKLLQTNLDAAKAQLSDLEAQRARQQSEPQSIPQEASEELLEQLRDDLAQARQDADTLRAAATIQAHPPDAESQNNTKSVADQLNDSVAEIRAELEKRHNERVKKAEDTFQKRSDAMKTQLNQKLTEGKDSLRRKLSSENEQALQNLRLAHAEQIETLKQRHQDELEELRRNEESRFEQFKNTWIADHPAQEAPTASTPKKEGAVPGVGWEPTDEEAKQFIASNATVKTILRRNVQQKVEEAKSLLASQLKEEHANDLARKLEEAQTKANISKEQAVLMETKRVGVKSSMLENRSKTAQMKLDLVQKAAQDTPQKPVQEVWIIVKDLKLTVSPQQPRQTPTANQDAPKVNALSQAPPLTQPQTQASSGQTAQGTVAPPPTQQNQVQNPSLEPLQTQIAPQQQQQQERQQASTPAEGSGKSNQQPPNLQNTSGLPVKPPQGSGNHHPTSGTGPATFRGLQQSGLPVARGGGPNRGVYQRARGQPGRGRGGSHPIDTNRNHPQQGTASPTQLSGAAKQFIPQGNKRPREGSDGGLQGAQGNDGKRIRGGGGGS
ncbi:MAG: hypothetical protein LQ342_003260 [Letrouitia transgressa]|nr:MAG: hypothetical protein LQ342_003260 [Letrouitia transgressa]